MHMEPDLSAVIMAGGRGERLGADKADILLGDRTLLSRTVDLLRPLTDDLVVVLRSDQLLAQVPLGVRLVRDMAPYEGVLAGIAAGLHSSRHEWALVVACDMPFLSASLVGYLASLRSGYDVVVPRLKAGLEPLHALYRRACLPGVLTALRAGQRRLVSFYDQLRVREVDETSLRPHDPDLRSVFNVNTREDLALAARLLAERDPAAGIGGPGSSSGLGWTADGAAPLAVRTESGSMPPIDVPDIVVRRLPYYLRALVVMANRGDQVVSSRDLGEWLGASPAQIRKDLSYYGEFGKQGLGYDVGNLRDELRAILQADRDWPVALVGAGALGAALVNYPVFSRGRFPIVAVFDLDPAKQGRRMRPDLEVQDVATMQPAISERGIRVAIVAVPADAAQEVADELVSCGIRAILNYAPIRLSLPPHVRCEDLDPVALLQSMTYYLRP